MPHRSCWCWAAPTSGTDLWILAASLLLGFHGRHFCGQTAGKRWSPQSSLRHPSSLTRLNIALPFTDTYHQLRRIHTHNKKCQNVSFEACELHKLYISSYRKKVGSPLSNASPHPLILLPNPSLIYINLIQCSSDFRGRGEEFSQQAIRVET